MIRGSGEWVGGFGFDVECVDDGVSGVVNGAEFGAVEGLPGF